MGHIPWSEAEKQIIREWFGKVSQTQVAKMLPGRSPQACWRIADAMGIKGRSLAEVMECSRAKWTPEQVEQYREELRVMGIKKFALKHHMGKHTVTRLAREHGIMQQRSMRAFTPEETERLLALSKEHTTTEIGILMGRTTRSVQQKCTRLGIKCRDNRHMNGRSRAQGPKQLKAKPPKPRLVKTVVMRPVDLCPIHRCPVSNWQAHKERTGCKAIPPYMQKYLESAA